jgi:hypothetical protein
MPVTCWKTHQKNNPAKAWTIEHVLAITPVDRRQDSCYVFLPYGATMVKFSPAVITARAALVVTLDSHSVGAACLVAVLLADGAAVALTRRRKPTKRG